MASNRIFVSILVKNHTSAQKKLVARHLKRRGIFRNTLERIQVRKKLNIGFKERFYHLSFPIMLNVHRQYQYVLLILISGTILTGERPFKCPFEGCTRSFTTSNIRKVHIRIHTGERPYVCNEEGCMKAFASATNYKNHIRIHTGTLSDSIIVS